MDVSQPEAALSNVGQLYITVDKIVPGLEHPQFYLRLPCDIYRKLNKKDVIIKIIYLYSVKYTNSALKRNDTVQS